MNNKRQSPSSCAASESGGKENDESTKKRKLNNRHDMNEIESIKATLQSLQVEMEQSAAQLEAELMRTNMLTGSPTTERLKRGLKQGMSSPRPSDKMEDGQNDQRDAEPTRTSGQSDIISQEQQKAFILTQAKRIYELEAELEKHRRHFAGMEKESANKPPKELNHHRDGNDQQEENATKTNQHGEQSSQIPELDVAGSATGDTKICVKGGLPSTLQANMEALRAELRDTVSLKEDCVVEELLNKIQSQWDCVAGEHEIVQIRLNDSRRQIFKALKYQNKMLEENQRLQRDKQGLQQSITKIKAHHAKENTEFRWVKEQFRQENETLLEEMEQMRTRHAMEVVLLVGSRDPTMELSKLKKELQRAHQRIQELQEREENRKII